jgi:RNA polymerase sigma-70 factor (ECF subfamily)
MIPVSNRSAIPPMSRDESLEAPSSTMTTLRKAPWIAAASPDDGSALARALEPYRDYLTLVARRAIGPELAPKLGASDLVQETFLAAQQHAETFRGRTEPEWRAWLKAILLHHLANQRRHHAADKRRGPEQDPGRPPRADGNAITPPSRRLMRRERDRALDQALSRLPERYRQVVGWHHHDGLGFNEIAVRLGISPDAAQKVWGRALVRLKELLGPEHDPR